MHHLLCGVALSLTAGCAAQAPPAGETPALRTLVFAGAVPAPTSADAYVLQAGDLLSIKFYYSPELNEDVVIRPDGRISLQLVGDVAAAGQSPAQLAALLSDRYAGELALPRINVIVRKLGGHRIYVGGEVEDPGALRLRTGLTLFQAIQEAGGFADTARRSQVILIRRGGGQTAGYSVDTRPIADGTQPDDDVVLRPYDIVYVPRSRIANVNLFVEQFINNNLPTVPVAFAP
jgi:protein involved in polysaccharide export with SLBB domain